MNSVKMDGVRMSTRIGKLDLNSISFDAGIVGPGTRPL